MPHTEHRKKSQRKADTAREINRRRRSAARTAVKQARAAVGGGKDASARVRDAMTAVDKAASYGVFHPNKAARMKSRLAKALNKAKPAAK